MTPAVHRACATVNTSTGLGGELWLRWPGIYATMLHAVIPCSIAFCGQVFLWRTMRKMLSFVVQRHVRFPALLLVMACLTLPPQGKVSSRGSAIKWQPVKI